MITNYNDLVKEALSDEDKNKVKENLNHIKNEILRFFLEKDEEKKETLTYGLDFKVTENIKKIVMRRLLHILNENGYNAACSFKNESWYITVYV